MELMEQRLTETIMNCLQSTNSSPSQVGHTQSAVVGNLANSMAIPVTPVSAPIAVVSSGLSVSTSKVHTVKSFRGVLSKATPAAIVQFKEEVKTFQAKHNEEVFIALTQVYFH
jgi:hypothetical protein